MARRIRKLMGDINVVPYIDVMLVLLIIFMLTAPMMSQGIKVDIPKVGGKPLVGDKSPLIFSVDKHGRFFLSIDSRPEGPLDSETVMQRVSAVIHRVPETSVLVRADATVPYQRVLEGIALLQDAGVQQVGFVADPATMARANRK